MRKIAIGVDVITAIDNQKKSPVTRRQPRPHHKRPAIESPSPFTAAAKKWTFPSARRTHRQLNLVFSFQSSVQCSLLSFGFWFSVLYFLFAVFNSRFWQEQSTHAEGFERLNSARCFSRSALPTEEPGLGDIATCSNSAAFRRA